MIYKKIMCICFCITLIFAGCSRGSIGKITALLPKQKIAATTNLDLQENNLYVAWTCPRTKK